MQDKIQSWLSNLLLLGIALSVILVLSGAILYLLQEGQNLVSYQQFSRPSNAYASFSYILQGVQELKPLALVQLGFFTLVFFQVLRVLIVGFFFLQTSEYLLALSSFFIFIILIYSMLWHK